jgi:hypothetical protein
MVDVPNNVISLFDDLIGRGEQIKVACKKMYFTGTKKAIDDQLFEAWRTSCLTLLRSTFGTSSPHYDSFINLKFFDYYNSTLLYLGILQGAKEDLCKGYFYNKDLMLSVNIFSSFLARSHAYWENGEEQRALGILESVLNETLRKLTESHGLPVPQPAKADGMADSLSKANMISRETHERLIDLCAIVSGSSGEMERPFDFETWNAWIQKFIYDHLGIRIIIEN